MSLEASSVRAQRHRLDRSGNRQLNAALYRIAITRARYYAPARAYLERKRDEGKSRREPLRCLKRQLARVVFNTLKASPALTYRVDCHVAENEAAIPFWRRLGFAESARMAELPTQGAPRTRVLLSNTLPLRVDS